MTGVRVRRAATTGGVLLAVGLGCATVAGCQSQPVQVEGTKFTASPSATPSPAFAAGPDGALAVRLVPDRVTVAVGQPARFTLDFADAHGGLVGTVDDYGDGGVGAVKLTDCHVTEKQPSSGTRAYRHTWSTPGTYTVRITVTTDSCTYGQEDATAEATVTVR